MKFLKLKDTAEFLIELDKIIEKETHIGLIGGTALEIFGLRKSTKDIDLVFFQQPSNELANFMNRYSEKNDIEVQFGLPGSFSSQLLDAEMFDGSITIPTIHLGIMKSYNFEKLKIHILKPNFFILVKLESASTRGERDMDDALSIQKYFKVTLKEFLEAVQNEEIYPLIRDIPRLITSIQIFSKKVYDYEFEYK